jgi:hypothetical protein
VDLPGNQGTSFAGGGASTMSQCHPDLTADLTAEARILPIKGMCCHKTGCCQDRVYLA